MKYKELFGNSIKDDIDEIKKEIDEDQSIVFVYSGAGTLYDYIDALYDKGRGLDAEYLYKFKVCYEKKDLLVSYSARNGKRSREIISMSSLVNELDGKNPCKIVVENDDRVQLAFIVQQLIFIEYPLEKVDILLRKEEKDADKTKRFMEKVNELLDGCENAIARLLDLRKQVQAEADDNPTKKERLKDIDDALESFTSIRFQILKSIDVELKFAVAAQKNLKDSFKNAVYENEVAEELRDKLTESVVDGYMNSLVEELKQAFESMNFTYMQYIERFRSAVDDRDKYKREIDLYKQRKANILSIGESANEFMDTWNMIIQGFIEDEQTEKNPVLD